MRSGNAKWLWERANTDPLLLDPRDAKRMGFKTGDLLRVSTDTGYFVNRLVVTEGLMPGIAARPFRPAPEAFRLR